MSDAEPRSERLQALLDRVAAGERAADLLAEVAHDRELASLLRVALDLSSALPTAPAPWRRARMQVRLQERMTKPATPSRTGRRLVPRILGLVTAVALMLVSAVAVSAESLPGQPLYGLKRAAERTLLALPVGPDLRARLYLGLADRRIAEVQELVDRGIGVPARLVEELIREAFEASDSGVEEARAADDSDLLRSAQMRADDADKAVRDIIQSAPPDVRPRLERVVEARSGRSPRPTPAAPDAALPAATPALPPGGPTATSAVVSLPTKPAPISVSPSPVRTSAPTGTGSPTPATTPEPTHLPTGLKEAETEHPPPTHQLAPTSVPSTATKVVGTAASFPTDRAATTTAEASRPTATPKRRGKPRHGIAEPTGTLMAHPRPTRDGGRVVPTSTPLP